MGNSNHLIGNGELKFEPPYNVPGTRQEAIITVVVQYILQSINSINLKPCFMF